MYEFQEFRVDEQVETFFKKLLESGDERYELVSTLRDLILERHPELEERMQYGGLLFYSGKVAYCGLFARKDHATLEMGNAAYIDDPYGLLQGSGTKEGRRHLKLREMSDIREMHVSEYLELTWATF